MFVDVHIWFGLLIFLPVPDVHLLHWISDSNASSSLLTSSGTKDWFASMTVTRLFAGDVGGYLGLLIGGSVLSIIEVVDLIFYNALLRCWTKCWCSPFLSTIWSAPAVYNFRRIFVVCRTKIRRALSCTSIFYFYFLLFIIYFHNLTLEHYYNSVNSIIRYNKHSAYQTFIWELLSTFQQT